MVAWKTMALVSSLILGCRKTDHWRAFHNGRALLSLIEMAGLVKPSMFTHPPSSLALLQTWLAFGFVPRKLSLSSFSSSFVCFVVVHSSSWQCLPLACFELLQHPIQRGSIM